MRKLVIIFATIVVGSLILVAASSAQRRGMPGERMYNPQTVETISGVVVSVGKFGGMKGTSQGVHAVVKTERRRSRFTSDLPGSSTIRSQRLVRMTESR